MEIYVIFFIVISRQLPCPAIKLGSIGTQDQIDPAPKHHAMNKKWKCLRIRNLGDRWKWVDSFPSRPRYPQGNVSGTHWTRG
jgi:hypothetical protein